MSEGKLLVMKDGAWTSLGEVKDLSEMETCGKYESNVQPLDLSSLPVTLTLNLADIDWVALIRANFGSLRKYTMVARRAAKKAARLRRKEFYLWRCRVRALAFRANGITRTYYNGKYRKLMVVVRDDDKWGELFRRIRRQFNG